MPELQEVPRNTMTAAQQGPLERLLAEAQRDSGQARRVATFLLSWWNSEECGGFALTDLWGLDTEIRRDLVTLFEFIADQQRYPDTLGYAKQSERIVSLWRPAREA
jgi:hypothetical protein